MKWPGKYFGTCDILPVGLSFTSSLLEILLMRVYFSSSKAPSKEPHATPPRIVETPASPSTAVAVRKFNIKL